jgi:hypothetical protein
MKKIRNKIAARLGLALVKFGIMIYESQPFGILDDDDKTKLKELWELHDKFAGEL